MAPQTVLYCNMYNLLHLTSIYHPLYPKQQTVGISFWQRMRSSFLASASSLVAPTTGRDKQTIKNNLQFHSKSKYIFWGLIKSKKCLSQNWMQPL